MLQDVPTQWGSTIAMIICLFQNRDTITACVEGQSHSLSLSTEAKWSEPHLLQKLLALCERGTTLLGGEEYATLSVVLPLVAYLEREMTISDDDPGNAQRFKEGLSADLFFRFYKIGDNGILQCSTALEQCFKMLKCIAKSERQAVWNLLHNLMKEVDTDTCDDPAAKISRKGSHVDMFNFGFFSKEECSDNNNHQLLTTMSCVYTELCLTNQLCGRMPSISGN